MSNKKKQQKKISAGEIVAYSITGFFWLGGLALCIMGVYAFNGPGRIIYNPMYLAQKGFSEWLGWSSTIDFRVFGTIICLISMAVFLMFAYHYANKNRVLSARRKRQLKRLNELIEKDKALQNIDEKETTEIDEDKVIDAQPEQTIAKIN